MAQHNKVSQAFGTLSITFQLQLCLIICYVLLCLALILITYYQLDWLRDVVITESEENLQDNMLRQIKAESYLKAQYVEEVFQNSQDTVHALVLLEIACIKSNYFVNTQVVQDTSLESGVVEYEYGVSMRQQGFGDSGVKSESEVSPLSYLWTGMYNKDFLYLQTGLSTQVNLVYPGFYFDDRSYEYQLRQWYYNLTENKYIITEPHYDEIFTNSSVFSISKMVEYSSRSAVQLKVKLDQVFQPIFLNSNQRYSQNYLLVSEAGFVLSISPDWEGKTGVIMKVYNETTGISESDWKTIKKAEDGEEVLKFTRPNNPYSVKDSTSGKTYYLVKSSLTFESNTYYLLVCYRYNSVDDQVDDIRSSFKDTFERIFYVILIIGIITVIIIFIVIKLAIRGLIAKFMKLQEVLQNLYSRALYKDSAQNLELESLLSNPGMFSRTLSAFSERMNALTAKEQENSHFFKRKIKAPDTFLYANWRNTKYPRKSLKNSSVSLQDITSSLKQYQESY